MEILRENMPFSDIYLQENQLSSNRTLLQVYPAAVKKVSYFLTTNVDYIGKILLNNNGTIQNKTADKNNQVKHGGQTSTQSNTCTISKYSKPTKQNRCNIHLQRDVLDLFIEHETEIIYIKLIYFESIYKLITNGYIALFYI